MSMSPLYIKTELKLKVVVMFISPHLSLVQFNLFLLNLSELNLSKWNWSYCCPAEWYWTKPIFVKYWTYFAKLKWIYFSCIEMHWTYSKKGIKENKTLIGGLKISNPNQFCFISCPVCFVSNCNVNFWVLWNDMNDVVGTTRLSYW